MSSTGMVPLRRRMVALVAAGASGLALTALTGMGASPAAAAAPTTAWGDGQFQVDTPNVVRRSDITLDQPPLQAKQSMPIGNGTFGAAVWAANGFTAQLNRWDTYPDRRSAGQLAIPGLAAMTSAADYQGSVDLYDATYRQSGGGMTATTYIRADKDEMVIDVTGADPTATQTATIDLQSGRHPTAAVSDNMGTLAETWVDTASATGGTGKTFGSLAAVRAAGRDMDAEVVNSNAVAVSFRPKADGSFRVVVGVPHWTGGDAAATAAHLLGGDANIPAKKLSSSHLQWWHDYWNKVNLIKLSSADGAADYMENLRTLFLYYEGSSERGNFPSSQAGVADLFNFTRDQQSWGGGQYWFWNMRMQIAANIGAGNFAMNEPRFRLYEQNIANIEAWTKTHMGGRPGICVPETMRFDGTGWYVGTGTGNPSCDQGGASSYNIRTISSGAEVASWVWRTYQATDDRAFLDANANLITEAARFLLASATLGSDGKLHTLDNAHETQWDVHDPITDIAAMKSLFPVAIQVAQLEGGDADLVSSLQAAIPEIPDYPRTDAATHQQLKTAADDGDGNTVLGFSSDPTATTHNAENLDLEPLWPYNLVSDTSPLFGVEKLTYQRRKYVNQGDWTYDSVDAARLQLGDDMAARLKASAGSFQQFSNGMANLSSGGNLTEPYDEQTGVTALAINESLAQDYDGILRIAPAVPTGWNAEGSVSLQHRSKVDVQVQGGVVTTAVIESGADHDIVVRNPWPGQAVQVVDGSDPSDVVVPTTTDADFTIHSAAGKSYVVQQTDAPLADLATAPITGTPATAVKHLAGTTVKIGIDPAGYLPPGPCATPTGSKLVSWDPTSGATIADLSSNHRDATFAGQQPAYASDGPTGSAAVLNGGYLTAGAQSMGYLYEATFAAEVKVNPGTSYRRIWDWKTLPGGDGDGIIVDLTPSGTVRIITAGANNTINSALPTGRFISLVVTIDKAGAESVYVDGTKVGGATLNSPGINGCASGATVRFGGDQGGGEKISGEVDRAAVFTRALSASEVANWQALATAP
jgi:hypothetical protein